MFIEKVKIRNFKHLQCCDVSFNEGMNIIVGNNEVGKSTLLEAITLALTATIGGRPISSELHPYLFSSGASQLYLESLHSGSPGPLPEISIEIFFGKCAELAHLMGDGNSDGVRDVPGLVYRISFDESYKESYQTHISNPARIKSIPVEYYEASCYSFARKPLRPRDIIFTPVIVDASRITTLSGTNRYVAGLLREALPESDQVQLSIAYRKLQDSFLDDESVLLINNALKQNRNILSNKELSITLNPMARGGWEASIMPTLDGIPITLAGKGEQNAVKIKLALQKRSEATLLLIEEPENHLSYSKMHTLVNEIKEHASGRQVILTTHSSYVLNKLGINNVILFKDGKQLRLRDLPADTFRYFQKLPGHDTLRVLLSTRAILVEGPSDELVLQKAFIRSHGVSALEKGVDIIAVGSLAFKRLLQIAAALDLSVDVVTDNDGNHRAVQERYADYTKYQNINIFVDGDDACKTLEPQIVKKNGVAKTNKIIEKNFQTQDDLLGYMEKNKTEVALRLFETSEDFDLPDYINDAVK